MPSLNKYIERLRYYCEEASVGYDWGRRWNLYDGGDTDCSALTIGSLNEAGFDTGDAVTTHNLSSNLEARGWVRLPPNISDVRPGDILLNDQNHVATVVEGYGWNALIAQASIGETGGVYGNQPGDQTGWETNVSPIYDYPWDCILRYEGPQDEDETDDKEFDMTEALFYIDDAHEGYNGGEVIYWSPAAGFCYLEHPDAIVLIKECNPDIKEFHSSKAAPWIVRAKHATNPTVAAKTYGKHN